MKNYKISRPNQPDNLLELASPHSPKAVLANFARQNQADFFDTLIGVFDNLDQGIIVTDKSGRVVIFNAAAERIMGYIAAEVVGQHTLWDFCDQCTRPPMFLKSLSKGRSFLAEEVEMQVRDPQRGPVGVRVTPLYNASRELAGAVATLRDLAESRAQESQQKSLIRLASIGRIISAVAHEINNPLQSIRTTIELGLDPKKSEAKREHYLKTADSEISRIVRIINQLRSFYRPVPGQEQPSDINECLSNALSILENPLKQAGITVELVTADDLPGMLVLNYQLEQVFLNLILNMVEALPPGSTMHIESQLDDEGDLAVCFYNADGKCITADPQNQDAPLFDPFASGQTGGLGLGLSVSQEIIRELGGHIEADYSEGLRITVTLPTSGVDGDAPGGIRTPDTRFRRPML